MYQVPQMNSSTGWTYRNTSGDPSFSGGVATWANSGTAATQPATWGAYAQTDFFWAQCTLGTPSSSQPSGVILRANSGFTNGVSVQATTAGIYIFTYASGTSSTNRASKTSLTITSGSKIMITAIGNVYTAYLNGVSEVSWTDSSNTQTIGVNNRLFGVVGVNGSSNSGPINTVIFSDTHYFQAPTNEFVPLVRSSTR